jgi:hypothetical protein
VLDRPVRGWWCAAAWVLATVVFVAWIASNGGPNAGDSDQSVVAVLAIARGQYHCAYPPDEATPMPPLYPMLAAGVVAAAGLDGPQVKDSPGLGPDCRSGSNIMGQVTKSHLTRVLWVGMIGWLALLAGFIALLRAARRGRTLWECVGVVVLACLLPAAETITTYYHPNDLLAMGLVLGAFACCLRSRWGWAGALTALACLSHQFALLVAVPLAVLTLAERRWRFVGAAVLTTAAVAGAAVALTGWRVVRAIVGEGVAPSAMITWVDRLGLGNDSLAVVSRWLPLVLAAALALVAVKRVGPSVWAPELLCSLMAMCLGLRLVFEINLVGYRLVAYVVMLLVLDWVCGRVRWLTVAFIVAVCLVWPLNSTFTLADQVLLVQAVAAVAYFFLVSPRFVRACIDGPSEAAPTVPAVPDATPTA